MHQRSEHPSNKAPAPVSAGARPKRSVDRVPDQGEDIVVILAGRAAKVDVDAARSELGGGEAQRDIVLAGLLAGLDPARAQFDRSAQHPVVGLAGRGFGAVGDDLDVGAYREGLDLASKAAVFSARDIAVSRQDDGPSASARTNPRLSGDPYGRACPTETIASSFFPRRAKRGSSRPLRSKKALRSGPALTLRPFGFGRPGQPITVRTSPGIGSGEMKKDHHHVCYRLCHAH